MEKVSYLTPNEHEAAILFAGQGKADILGRNQGMMSSFKAESSYFSQPARTKAAIANGNRYFFIT